MDAKTRMAEEHRLKKLFHELDANNDGRIDIHELTEGLHKLGYFHITEEQILVSEIYIIIFLNWNFFFISIQLKIFFRETKF